MNLRKKYESFIELGFPRGVSRKEIGHFICYHKKKIGVEGYFHETGFCKVGGDTYNYNLRTLSFLNLYNIYMGNIYIYIFDFWFLIFGFFFFVLLFGFSFLREYFVASWDSVLSGLAAI